MRAEVQRVESFLVENRGQRQRSSLQDLADLGEFFTIDEPFIETAEAFLSSLPSDSALQQVLSVFGAETNVLPDGPLLVTKPTGVLSEMFYTSWQVSEVWVKEHELRITARWTSRVDRANWINEASLEQFWPIREIYTLYESIGTRVERTLSRRTDFHIPLENVPFDGLTDYDGVITRSQTLLSPTTGYITEIGGPTRINQFSDQARVLFHFLLYSVYVQGLRNRHEQYGETNALDYGDLIESRISPTLQRLGWLDPDESSELLQCLPKRSLRLFTTDLGSRRIIPYVY
jgi:hypothetical protein